WILECIGTGGCAITGGSGLLPASGLGPLSALGAGVTAGIWLVWCLAWGLVRSLVIRRILLGWARGIILVLVLVVLRIVRILLIRRRRVYRLFRLGLVGGLVYGGILWLCWLGFFLPGLR